MKYSGLVVGCAFLAPLLFPVVVVYGVLVVAAVLVPWAALLAGLFADIVYFSPGDGMFPVMSIVGAIASLAGQVVRRSMKTGII